MSYTFGSSLTHTSSLWQFLKSETLMGKPMEGFANWMIKEPLSVVNRKVTPCFIWFRNLSRSRYMCALQKYPREGFVQPGVFSEFPYKAAVYFGRSSWKLVSTCLGISIYSTGILEPLADWCPGRLPSWPAQLAQCLRTLGET